MSDGWRAWAVPAFVALLVAGLGVATNLATDLKSNWIAWAVVFLLTISIAAAAAASERRKQGQVTVQAVMAKTTAGTHSSQSRGIQMRRVRTSSPDGSITVVEEIFSEELARQTLRDTPVTNSDEFSDYSGESGQS